MPNRPLTPAERLWLWRWSRGYTQGQAAKVLGVGRGLVSAVERWQHPVLRRWGKLQARGGVTPWARLALARRRSGLGLAEVALRLGVSRVTVLAMERRADPALVRFWKGFTFAR